MTSLQAHASVLACFAFTLGVPAAIWRWPTHVGNALLAALCAAGAFAALFVLTALYAGLYRHFRNGPKCILKPWCKCYRCKAERKERRERFRA